MIEKKILIETFANELADKLMKSDMFYYECNDKEMSSVLLDHAIVIKELSSKLGVYKEVYKRANEIYKFKGGRKNLDK